MKSIESKQSLEICKLPATCHRLAQSSHLRFSSFYVPSISHLIDDRSRSTRYPRHNDDPKFLSQHSLLNVHFSLILFPLLSPWLTHFVLRRPRLALVVLGVADEWEERASLLVYRKGIELAVSLLCRVVAHIAEMVTMICGKYLGAGLRY